MGHSHRVAMDRAKVRVSMPWAANGMKSQVRTKSNRFVSVLAKFEHGPSDHGTIMTRCAHTHTLCNGASDKYRLPTVPIYHISLRKGDDPSFAHHGKPRPGCKETHQN